MAETETIREFLVSLGFEVKQDQEKKFTNAIASATKAVVSLGAAVTGSALLIVAGVENITRKFEGLYYSSQRVGSSIGNIKSFGYAASQLGSSVEKATGSLEAFGAKLRENPKGYEFWLKQLGVIATVNGKMRDSRDILVDLGKVLSKTAKDNYYLARSLAEQAGLDEDTFRAIINPDFASRVKESDSVFARMGFDPQKMGEQAVKIENAFRKIGLVLETIKDKVASLISENLRSMLERFGSWLEDHADDIAGGLETIAKWVLEAAQGLAEFIGGIGANPEKWRDFLNQVKEAGKVIWKLAEGIGWLLDKAKQLFGITGAQGATSFGGNGAGGAAAGGFTGGEATSGLDQGASRSWRNNNPGNIKYSEFARAHGATGADANGFAIFPSVEAGTAAQRALWDSKGYSDLTIEAAARKWSANGYGADKLGIDGARSWSSLSDDEKAAVLSRQRTAEGWFAGGGNSDAPAAAGTRPLSSGITTITTKSGKRFQVAAEYAENFRGFLNDYEAAGGVISGNSGGLGSRPGNASYHPLGRAIDVNQIGRNIRAGGVTLPLDVENSLAAKWGLRSGANFSNPDAGHFEVNSAENALAALKRQGLVPENAQVNQRAPSAKDRAFTNYAFGPNAKSAAQSVRQAFSDPSKLPDTSGARPLGSLPIMASQSTNINAPQQITIHGISDPKEAAHELSKAGQLMNNRILRNMQGAAQ